MKRKIGIDEAGRGPWYGPVVAAAVSFDPRYSIDSLRHQLCDSKVLTPKKRKEIFDEIINHSHKASNTPLLHFGVGYATSYEIDTIGIKSANRLAMERALTQLKYLLDLQDDHIDSVLIDGNDGYRFDSLLTKSPISIIKGDTKVPEIQAASILAKVWRDSLMQSFALVDPTLGIESHQGYGTLKHRNGIARKKEKISEFHRHSYAPIRREKEQKPKLLIHVCCGPDATVPIMDLKKDYELLCFWYDPNIHPKAEYDKRLEAFKQVCEIEKVAYIEGEYDITRFFQVIKGYEDTPEKGEKCTLCYDMRLERSAQLAKELGYTHYTSTLNTSPHKDLEKMFRLGDKHGEKYGLKFLKIAFRKNGGFQRSVDYTHEHDIYRQDYCGCVYSDTFPLRVQNAKDKIIKRGFSG